MPLQLATAASAVSTVAPIAPKSPIRGVQPRQNADGRAAGNGEGDEGSSDRPKSQAAGMSSTASTT